MKKITIGRNNACDVIVPDTTNIVSRRQAVLTVTPWGSMMLYDTSNNGTYINGRKLEKGKGMKVTRKDRVNFGGVIDMDWDWVNDPYRLHKQVALWFGLAVFVFIIVLTVWILLPLESYQEEKETVKANESALNFPHLNFDEIENNYALVIEKKDLSLYYHREQTITQ